MVEELGCSLKNCCHGILVEANRIKSRSKRIIILDTSTTLSVVQRVFDDAKLLDTRILKDYIALTDGLKDPTRLHRLTAYATKAFFIQAFSSGNGII